MRFFGSKFLRLMMLAVFGLLAQNASAVSFDYYTLPTGTLLKVESLDNLSSKTANKGDVFQAVVIETLYRDEVALIPSGTLVFGKVLTVEKAENQRRNGLLAIEFTDLQFPDGTRRRLNGDLAERFDYREFPPPFRIISVKSVRVIDGGKSLDLGNFSIKFLSKFFETDRGEILSAKEQMFAKGSDAEIGRGADFLVKINHRLTIPVTR